MAEQKSSFIPASPVRVEAASASRSRKVYVLTYVSFVLFFGAVIATVIVFFIGFQEQRNLEFQQSQLDQEFEKFSKGELAEVQELSIRLSEAKRLLDQTVSPVSILAALEISTVRSVTISDLKLSKQDDGKYLLELIAKAPHFNATRYQRDLITGNPVLAGATISQTTYGTISDSTKEKNTEEEATNEELVTFTISKVLSVDDIPHLTTQPTDLMPEPVLEDATVLPEGESVSALEAVSEVLADDALFGDLEADAVNE